MPRATVSDVIELEYETFGDPADPTVLMVMGFTAQMTSWKTAFCELFAEHGFHVVRYDNRDCGLSTKLSGRPDPRAVAAAMMSGGEVPEVPYTLSDMAADGIGLLDHLGVDRAVVFGASMGGMIAQTMAIEHPRRVAALVSVMSMPGSPDVGQASEEAMSVLLTPPPTERSAYVENASNALVWASRRYGDADELRTMAAAAYDRSFYPDGAPVAAGGDLRLRRPRREARPALRADARHPRSRRHPDLPVRRLPHRRADSYGTPDDARRHGTRPSRAVVASDRGRHGGARQSGAERVSKLAALRTMLGEHVEHLPVVEDGRLVGICTRTDVLSARRTQIEHERRQPGWSQVVLPRMFARWSPADN